MNQNVNHVQVTSLDHDKERGRGWGEKTDTDKQVKKFSETMFHAVQ